MHDLPTMLGGTLGIAVFVFLIVLAILWFCLPFAVFGLKPLLREILAEQKQTNRNLEGLLAVTLSLPTSPTASSTTAPKIGRP